MAVDFRVVEEAVRDAVSGFDHAYLNDLEPFGDSPPTAERLAVVVCERTSDRLAAAAPAARVDAVEIWETPQYRVEYRP
jgi:6-pyruvoyl-tetrahydropterin synthase